MVIIMKANPMKIVRTIAELDKLLNQDEREQQSVGFVPTMGFLHEGHLSLVQEARKQHDLVVMSIFVNPAQFGPGEDFEAYPRDEQRDAELASRVGVAILFMPEPKEMYPNEGDITILPGAQAKVLCGVSRPGHFDGVLKIVLKLFNIVNPDASYFGMKDAQQLAIIESFVRDFNVRTKIVRVPTVREADGLAKSSRNVNLSVNERQEASVIYQALQKGVKMFQEGRSVGEIEREVAMLISTSSSGSVDYVSLLSYPELKNLDSESEEAILACAVQFEKPRLIDNIIFETKGCATCLE